MIFRRKAVRVLNSCKNYLRVSNMNLQDMPPGEIVDELCYNHRISDTLAPYLSNPDNLSKKNTDFYNTYSLLFQRRKILIDELNKRWQKGKTLERKAQ